MEVPRVSLTNAGRWGMGFHMAVGTSTLCGKLNSDGRTSCHRPVRYQGAPCGVTHLVAASPRFSSNELAVGDFDPMSTIDLEQVMAGDTLLMEGPDLPLEKGWYPDPEVAGRLQYFDGERFVDAYRDFRESGWSHSTYAALSDPRLTDEEAIAGYQSLLSAVGGRVDAEPEYRRGRALAEVSASPIGHDLENAFAYGNVSDAVLEEVLKQDPQSMPVTALMALASREDLSDSARQALSTYPDPRVREVICDRDPSLGALDSDPVIRARAAARLDELSPIVVEQLRHDPDPLVRRIAGGPEELQVTGPMRSFPLEHDINAVFADYGQKYFDQNEADWGSVAVGRRMREMADAASREQAEDIFALRGPDRDNEGTGAQRAKERAKGPWRFSGSSLSLVNTPEDAWTSCAKEFAGALAGTSGQDSSTVTIQRHAATLVDAKRSNHDFHSRMHNAFVDGEERIENYERANGHLVDLWCRAVEDETQSKLAQAGISHIEVARGMRLKTADAEANGIHPISIEEIRQRQARFSAADPVAIPKRPLSSFAMKRGNAESFAGDLRGDLSQPHENDTTHILIRAQVPAKSVFGVSSTGAVEAWTENEVLVKSDYSSCQVFAVKTETLQQAVAEGLADPDRPYQSLVERFW